jgi:mRNA-degrading endonuclease RelE of RelBE toxin-antitoxin system
MHSIYLVNFKIEVIDEFEKDLKKLSKKYPSLKKDYENMLYSLLANPQQGEPLGKDCYKIRMAISSKGQGKSGGARLITNVKIVKEKIYLIAIYDKSDMENISDKELKERLKGIK